MAKDPAFLFYSSDFITGVAFMSDEQVGKYIRLLCMQHLHGRLSEKHMMHICRTYDADIFAKFKKDDSGLYYNQRVEDEINKRKNFSESRKANRISKKQHISSTYVQSYDQHMENENENENINENKDESKNENVKAAKPKIEIVYPFNSEKFMQYWEIWKDYKSKDHKFKFKSAGSEQASLNELVKLASGNEHTAILIIQQSMAKGWKGFFELKTDNNGNTKTQQARVSHITDQQLHEAFTKRFGSR
jgi:hypothetical protein